MRAQLRQIAVFDVRLQRELKILAVEFEGQTVRFDFRKRLNHLAIGQAQLLGHGRVHIGLTQGQVNG